MIAANLLAVGIALAVCSGLYSVQLLNPLNNAVTDDRTPLFGWSGEPGDENFELLVDNDPAFGSPLVFDVAGNSFEPDEEMDFGTYWWKLRRGDWESAARRFTVVSTVALSRPYPEIVRNTGNTGLLVYSGSITGAATLAVNGTLEVREEENVKAEQQ
jgi:hypothetical protein